jgi:PAS domain S-box-containing protein
MGSSLSLDILVVEDDPDTRANLRDVLELDDHRVEIAATAAEALGRPDLAKFPAVILDRRLPDAVADELLPRLRAAAPETQFILVTGYSDIQGAISALRQGATDYILKPIDPDELRARLNRIAVSQRVDHEIKRQAEIIQSLLTNASDAIFVVDVRGIVLLCNPAVSRLIGAVRVGAPPEEWPDATRAFHADGNTPYSRDELPLARALRRELIVDEQVFIRSPGNALGSWMSVNASPVCDGGEVKGAVVIYRDISERKRVEDGLRRAEERFRLLVKNSSDIISALAEDGTILYLSPSIERLLGRRPENRVGSNVFADPIVHPDDLDRKRAFLRKVVERPGELTAAEFRLRHADGTWRHFEAVGQNLLSDPTVGAIIANYRDITERKRAEERARQAERLAAIGEMVAGLAHESRNAMQRSQACLEMLALSDRDFPASLDLIARIQKAQDHLHHLYEDVRQYAAPIHLNRSLCDLRDIWREAWENLEPARQGRRASLRDTASLDRLSCPVDPFRLGRVFYNLFDNSLAAGSDPLEVTVDASRCMLDGRPAVCVTVGDNGPGLDPEQKSKVFDPFYTTKAKGTGLGMAITRRIVEAHGGRIAVGDEESPGAVFHITLPTETP